MRWRAGVQSGARPRCPRPHPRFGRVCATCTYMYYCLYSTWSVWLPFRASRCTGVLLFLIGAAPRIEHHGLQRFTIAHARWLLRAGNGRVVPRQERLQSLGLSITHPDNLTEQLGISGPPIVKIGRPSAGPPQAPSSPLAPTCPATSVSPQLPFPFPLPPSPPPYHSPHL